MRKYHQFYIETGMQNHLDSEKQVELQVECEFIV